MMDYFLVVAVHLVL
jgi:hypothetical protein